MGFNNIIGHDKQKQLLLSFLENERMPHAFLFSGQDGIGKKKTALEFVKYIFCEHKSACGTCKACIKVDRGLHPDLCIIGPRESRDGAEQYIRIEDIRGDEKKKIRGIIQEVYEYPYEAEKRAIIVDNAHRLTHEAANALLKTLEEPPIFNVFFLITAHEELIPQTIRSRCSRVFFTSLSERQLEEYFTGFHNLSGEEAEIISAISYGSISAGLFWMEEENFRMRNHLAELISGKKTGFLAATFLAEKITKTMGGFSMYLSFLLALFRDIAVLNISREPSMVINQDVRHIIEHLTADQGWIEESIKRIQDTTHIMRYNINKWLIFENLLLHVMRHV